MSAAKLIGVLVVAMLEGCLVALPRPDALARLSRLRSPAWTAVLPGSVIVGTFAPLWRPSLAPALVQLAALATPLLAMLSALVVARGRRALLITAALALLAAAEIASGPVGQLSSSAVTALGCLSVGIVLTRLIPRRWLLVGVALMCSVDVLLLTAGPGQPAAALLADATAGLHGPAFDSATVGSVTVDYPDLVLAAALGGFVADHGLRRRVALTLTLLAAGSGMMLAVVDMLPATVPIGLTLMLFAGWDRASSRRRWRTRAAQPGRVRAQTPPLAPFALQLAGGSEFLLARGRDGRLPRRHG